MIKQIVVGTDGSTEARKAFDEALLIAQRIECSLKCVFIIDLRKTQMPFIYAGGAYEGAYERIYIPPDPSVKAFYEKMADDLDAFAEKCIAELRQAAEEAGVAFESIVKSGYPGMELCDEARSGGILAIGQRGENAHYKRSIVGSIAEDLTRQSPRPLLICPSCSDRLETVLFPYDGSRTAEHALQFYVNGLKSLANDFVLLLVGDETSEEHAVEEELSYFNKHEIPVRIARRQGVPSSEILKVAEEENVDLVVLGAHGKNKLRDYLVGSTASHIIHKSTVPVLLVY